MYGCGIKWDVDGREKLCRSEGRKQTFEQEKIGEVVGVKKVGFR